MLDMSGIVPSGLACFPGGVVIKMAGDVVGGIGVSGASSDQDEDCALAGFSLLESETLTTEPAASVLV